MKNQKDAIRCGKGFFRNIDKTSTSLIQFRIRNDDDEQLKSTVKLYLFLVPWRRKKYEWAIAKAKTSQGSPVSQYLVPGRVNYFILINTGGGGL